MTGRGAGVAGSPGCLREKGEKLVIRIGWEIRMENWERRTGGGVSAREVTDVFNVVWLLFSELVPLALLSSSAHLATLQRPC